MTIYFLLWIQYRNILHKWMKAWLYDFKARFGLLKLIWWIFFFKKWYFDMTSYYCLQHQSWQWWILEYWSWPAWFRAFRDFVSFLFVLSIAVQKTSIPTRWLWFYTVLSCCTLNLIYQLLLLENGPNHEGANCVLSCCFVFVLQRTPLCLVLHQLYLYLLYAIR